MLLPITRELTPTETATVAKIEISYRVLPQRGKVPTNNRGTTLLQTRYFVRTVDPNDFDPDNRIALNPHARCSSEAPPIRAASAASRCSWWSWRCS